MLGPHAAGPGDVGGDVEVDVTPMFDTFRVPWYICAIGMELSRG